MELLADVPDDPVGALMLVAIDLDSVEDWPSTDP